MSGQQEPPQAQQQQPPLRTNFADPWETCRLMAQEVIRHLRAGGGVPPEFLPGLQFAANLFNEIVTAAEAVEEERQNPLPKPPHPDLVWSGSWDSDGQPTWLYHELECRADAAMSERAKQLVLITLESCADTTGEPCPKTGEYHHWYSKIGGNWQFKNLQGTCTR